MAKCCGGGARRNRPRTDKRGNSLENYAFLHPHQRKILEAQKAAEKEQQDKKGG